MFKLIILINQQNLIYYDSYYILTIQYYLQNR